MSQQPQLHQGSGPGPGPLGENNNFASASATGSTVPPSFHFGIDNHVSILC